MTLLVTSFNSTVKVYSFLHTGSFKTAFSTSGIIILNYYDYATISKSIYPKLVSSQNNSADLYEEVI